METTTRKHIVMFLGNNPYPHDTRVHPEALALVKAGFEVSVISPKAQGQPFIEELEGVKAYRYPAPPELESVFGYFLEYAISFIGTFIYTLYILFRHGFDVMHAHNPPDIFVLIGMLFKPFKKRYVFDHHDLSVDLYSARSDGNGNPAIMSILNWFEKRTCQTADMIITTNGSYKRLNIERHQVAEEKIKIVRNGANLNRLKIVEKHPDLAKMDKTILGFVGGMGKQDGVEYLIKAIDYLRHNLKRTDFYCVLVGGGGEFDTLQQMVVDHNLCEFVEFVGVLDGFDLNQYYSSMDICIDPDPTNSFNNHSTMIKMMEYMAFGKPIVAFDLHEHRVSAEDAAMYIPDNDWAEMAKAITHLIDHPELQKEMGEYGRNRVLNSLTWEHSGLKLIEAYQYLFPHVPMSVSFSNKMADQSV
ncbi:MAG: glycosyltransferase family 4 protein [Chloroflexota bacterium]